MMDHNHHHLDTESNSKEYAKFAVIIISIVFISYFAASIWGGVSLSNFLRMFMGTFFLVFAAFKLLDLEGFTNSYIGYDIIAKRFRPYAYSYPFFELALGLGSFLAVPYINIVTLFFMAIGSIGVFKELVRGSKIKCACLGTFIKLPLTTISLVENLAMGIMALIMILKII